MLSLLFGRMKRGGNLFCSGVENVELCMFPSLFYFLACMFEVFKKVLQEVKMIKTRNSSRDRDSKGRFEKFCGAIIHDNNESEYQLKLIGNKVKNEIKSYIFQNNIVKKHTLYICTKCIEKVQCLILKKYRCKC